MGFKEIKKEAAKDRVRTMIERMLSPDTGYSWEEYTREGESLEERTEQAKEWFKDIMANHGIEVSMFEDPECDCGPGDVCSAYPEEPCAYDDCDITSAEEDPVDYTPQTVARGVLLSKLSRVVDKQLDAVLAREGDHTSASELQHLINAMHTYKVVTNG